MFSTKELSSVSIKLFVDFFRIVYDAAFHFQNIANIIYLLYVNYNLAFKDSLFARSNILFTCTYAFVSFMLLIYNVCIWNWLMLFERSLQHDVDFSQDCSIRSFHFASLTFCWYFKNGSCFFFFFKIYILFEIQTLHDV